MLDHAKKKNETSKQYNEFQLFESLKTNPLSQ